MVLCEVVSHLLPKEQLVIAHFNHLTRGEESQADLELVKNFANGRKIRFEVGSRQGNKVGEAQLRKERLAFFEKVRKSHRCDFILLAHHLQDQLETFLMRLLRGTGLDGLSVMQPKNGRWVRPLLNVSKETLLEEAKKRGVSFRHDSSNFEPGYFRNQVRLNLLPEMDKLAQVYGGREKWLERLPLLFEELSWAKKELLSQTEEWLGRVLVETEYWVRIPKSSFEAHSAFQKARALRWILERLGVEPLSQTQMKQALMRMESGIKRFSVTGVEITYSCGYFYFLLQRSADLKSKLKFTYLENEVRCAELGLVLKPQNKLEGFELRTCLPGDRFEGKKLKEYFLKRRIPRPERELMPLIAKEKSKEVIWVLSEKRDWVFIESLKFPFSYLEKDNQI
jgi:tRNA(Ile)-lysidine synthase